MRYTDILKRAVPFIATFVLGLFVASFFVTLSAPRVGYKRHSSCTEKRLRMENENLRQENQIIEMRLKELQSQMPDGTVQRFEAPAAPPAPRVITPYEGVSRPVLTEEERQFLENVQRESRR